jgi:hypothetical protein
MKSRTRIPLQKAFRFRPFSRQLALQLVGCIQLCSSLACKGSADVGGVAANSTSRKLG